MFKGCYKDFVYVGLVCDLTHFGHINILNKAAKRGPVIVGLLTDAAIKQYKKKPVQSYVQRKMVVGSLKQVWKVVPQHTLSYKKNLLKYRPKYVFHGTDWRTGVQKNVRNEVINTLKGWSGKLIEVPYTKGTSSTILKKCYLKLK